MYQFKEESIQNSKRNSLANTVFYHNKLRKWARHARDEVHRLEDEYKTLDIFLFHPLEPFKIYWDLAVMLILMYVSMDIPFRICFEVNLPLFCPYEIWDLCIDIFFYDRYYFYIQHWIFARWSIHHKPKAHCTQLFFRLVLVGLDNQLSSPANYKSIYDIIHLNTLAPASKNSQTAKVDETSPRAKTVQSNE